VFLTLNASNIQLRCWTTAICLFFEDYPMSLENNAKQEILEAKLEILDPDPFDNATKKMLEETRALIERQWKNQTLAGIVVATLIVAVIGFAFYFARGPEHGKHLAAMDKSAQQLQLLATALADSSTACCAGQEQRETCEQRKICEDAKAAIGKYAADYKKVSDDLVLNDQQPKPEAIALTQLVGGSAIVVLLGFLGLMRLQNLDVEINNLRTSTDKQISIRVNALATTRVNVLAETVKGLDTEINNLRTSTDNQIAARVKELAENVQYNVINRLSAEVQNGVVKAIETIGAAEETIQKTVAGTKKEIDKSKREALDQIEEVQTQLNSVLARYPWLSKSELREGLSELEDIPSVERAHELAVELTARGDKKSALAVLRVIVEENLPGDKADFHNSHSQCMRLDNPTLALEIVEAGLRLCPDDCDLIADKAQALNALGRPLEARKHLEDWLGSKPDEFVRSWRPVVFYAKAVEAGTLDEEVVGKLTTAFESVVDHAPYEQKVWSAYGRFLEKLGKIEEVEDVLQRGIEYNPYSQELNYVLGEFYLRTGNAEKAVAKLEIAARRDYQSQYQHDINQHSVLCTLAQAYEAADEPKRAVKLYQSLTERPGVMGQIQSYAQQRLQMLAALGDEPIDIPESPLAKLAQLAKLLEAHHEDNGNEDGEAKLPGERHEDGGNEDGENEDGEK
jgi:tetratricopeptide (TPR) repeat protein